jgi:hypothetical protein
VDDSTNDAEDLQSASTEDASASAANLATTTSKEGSAEPSEAARAFDISGTWSTEYVYRGDPSKIPIEFTQHGVRISGTSGKSKITGELSGRVFVGQWKEGRAKGGLRFEFSEDGRRFEGSWDTAGNPDNGSWNGERES